MRRTLGTVVSVIGNVPRPTPRVKLTTMTWEAQNRAVFGARRCFRVLRDSVPPKLWPRASHGVCSGARCRLLGVAAGSAGVVFECVGVASGAAVGAPPAGVASLSGPGVAAAAVSGAAVGAPPAGVASLSGPGVAAAAAGAAVGAPPAGVASLSGPGVAAAAASAAAVRIARSIWGRVDAPLEDELEQIFGDAAGPPPCAGVAPVSGPGVAAAAASAVGGGGVPTSIAEADDASGAESEINFADLNLNLDGFVPPEPRRRRGE
jgi:hypothetical protein